MARKRSLPVLTHKKAEAAQARLTPNIPLVWLPRIANVHEDQAVWLPEMARLTPLNPEDQVPS